MTSQPSAEQTAPASILSIQSWVAYGHVGNAAAVFPLQRLGHEVQAVNTVQFSNHTGYPAWRGSVFPASEIAEVIRGLVEHGTLARCNALLSGFLGDPATARVILDTARQVRTANPRSIYCCDPVMGDERGFYVHQDIPGLLRSELLPEADILTPNHFELEHLCQRQVGPEEVVAAAGTLRERLRPGGPRLVVVSSVPPAAAGGKVSDTIIVSDTGAHLVRTPRLQLPRYLSGAGDVLAALLLGHYLKNRNPVTALQLAVSGLYAVLQTTVAAGQEELQLIAAQKQLVSPTEVFPAEQLA